tara:strand:+ start:2386 stop:2670 length:285 start_codon:yes stop_codon:yes gene_type:complete
MTKTNFGVIRKSKSGVVKGYVDMGADYFCYNECDVLFDYIDLGYEVVNNKYLIVGGNSITYYYRYRTEHGEKVEEQVEEITHPTMLMVTELKAN